MMTCAQRPGAATGGSQSSQRNGVWITLTRSCVLFYSWICLPLHTLVDLIIPQ